MDCDALVGDIFGEFSSHSRAGLDCLQLSDIGGPPGMGEESLCEDTSSGTNSSLRVRIGWDRVCCTDSTILNGGFDLAASRI